MRADVFVLTKTDKASSIGLLCNDLRQINSRALIVESRHVVKSFRDIVTGQVEELGDLIHKRMVAFCAIGDTSSFEFTLHEEGLKVVKNFIFPDHHGYTSKDMDEVLAFAHEENINILVTTHKDAVKMAPFTKLFQRYQVLSLDIDLKITQGQDEIIKRILSLRCN